MSFPAGAWASGLTVVEREEGGQGEGAAGARGTGGAGALPSSLVPKLLVINTQWARMCFHIRSLLWASPSTTRDLADHLGHRTYETVS
jgi:hypothetical protein